MSRKEDELIWESFLKEEEEEEIGSLKFNRPDEQHQLLPEVEKWLPQINQSEIQEEVVSVLRHYLKWGIVQGQIEKHHLIQLFNTQIMQDGILRWRTVKGDGGEDVTPELELPLTGEKNLPPAPRKDPPQVPVGIRPRGSE